MGTTLLANNSQHTLFGVVVSVCHSEKFDQFQTLHNNSQQHATTCNYVCIQTQHVTSNNVLSVSMGLNICEEIIYSQP